MTATNQGSYKLAITPPSADNGRREATTAFLALYGLRNDIAQSLSTAQQGQALANLGLTTPAPPQGRLTLTSGVPVLTAAVSGATAVLYTPYIGQIVPLWNGSSFVPTTFAELSQALSDTTNSPSAAAAGSVYDLFVWSKAGTSTLSRGPAWSAGATAGSTTVRGSGAGSTSLARQAGLLVNAVAIANGPAAGYGTYLGTIATDAGGGTVTFTRGGPGSYGAQAVIGLWNVYNRRPVGGTVSDTTSTWTYASATWRAANAGNVRVTYVAGLAEDAWAARYNSITQSSGSGVALTSIGSDTTTSVSGTTSYFNQSGFALSGASDLVQQSALGQHYMAAVEYSSSGTMTGVGTQGSPVNTQSGLTWSGSY